MEFDIVRRGYDRGQVDAYVAAVLGTGAEPTGFRGFDLTRRGYDRVAVDAWISAQRAAAAQAD
ncbi:hypothetical protein [Streptacidiphilus carbonis]|uniref:hypothetical protein n=1 Tax=Streptacidiphilus carbonis TaxID=105422 RepID=UPI0005AA801B|nr:hypothetical protein [Streptacidiphilus carbonis]